MIFIVLFCNTFFSGSSEHCIRYVNLAESTSVIILPVKLKCRNLIMSLYPPSFIIMLNIASAYICNHIKQSFSFYFSWQPFSKNSTDREKCVVFSYILLTIFFLPNILRFLLWSFSFCLENFLIREHLGFCLTTKAIPGLFLNDIFGGIQYSGLTVIFCKQLKSIMQLTSGLW